jgi:predicted small metal-binding protein
MTKEIVCPCGYVIRATDDATLVAQAQDHARKAHGMELTRDQALSMAQPT